MTDLYTLVLRHAAPLVNSAGLAHFAMPGIMGVMATAPSGLEHDISRPLVCLVLQGAKRVTVGARTFRFSAGDSLLITADMPMASQITEASAVSPYLSLVVELDATLIAELVMQMEAEPASVRAQAPARVQPTETEVADAALRLMRLLDHPEAIAILHQQRLREFHYWLLAGALGPAIRHLGWPGGPAQRVARAVSLLRNNFAQQLPIEQLAAAAAMSPSSFHQHFKAVTSLSPLQFQKQLRLIEARRLMLSEGMNASNAAFRVGYESVPQFTREYRRMFGLPPAQETGMTKNRVRLTA
ncbi:AraC family transcriptional regulator [Allopusillimonas soli]|uniref:AraC family transcriptional regulator n=1 Tax=Allopusillimonas soli TaxID=659016 RepID=A0A853F9Q6_9BURK|nr:AraC family transcriptional regulator [Allopusillimonas soli]NYT37425.1 AraC family transcriptional regulator [Allopusillimonas soli]TEA74593.1 AraC family transcriptional regulator [Allopusillimonas soli]